MDVSPGQIIPLFTWIKTNKLWFSIISITLLTIYGAYRFIDGFANLWGVEVAQHRVQNELRQASVTYQIFDSILQKDLIKYNASRVGLIRLHNNQRDTSGMSFFFAAVDSIVAAPGIAIDLPQIANLPLQTYRIILSKLMRGDPAYGKTVDLEHSELKQLLERRGTHYYLYIPIMNLTDDIIGFLAFSWLDDRNAPSSEEISSIVESLKSDAYRISGYLILGGSKK